MTSKYPRKPDATIRMLKALYMIGEVRSMEHYYDRWDLEGAEKTERQHMEARQLKDLIAEMREFERIHGNGSCLQLEDPSVRSLIERKFYAESEIANALSAQWKPSVHFPREYPDPRTWRSSSWSKPNHEVETVLSS